MSEIITKDLLGPGKFNQLPFLLKILSIEKALSIQSHPDKELAQKLHKEFPKIYKDDNHKPEMSIALTKFEALCGFREISEIEQFMKMYPELSLMAHFSGSLKQLFTDFMNCNEYEKPLLRLKERLERIQNRNTVEELFLRLYKQFPGDIGLVCVFLLNFLELEPFEAFSMGPNEPHAYISGDCIECMANSDNVIRAGLTPKFRDVQVLTSMLDYKSINVSTKIIKPKKTKEGDLYLSGFEEFDVLVVDVDGAKVVDEFCGPSLLLVLSGFGSLVEGDRKHEMKRGSVFFVRSNSCLKLFTESKMQCVIARCLNK